jgi:hypothetical protein
MCTSHVHVQMQQLSVPSMPSAQGSHINAHAISLQLSFMFARLNTHDVKQWQPCSEHPWPYDCDVEYYVLSSMRSPAPTRHSFPLGSPASGAQCSAPPATT